MAHVPDDSKHSRYSKVLRRVWNDAKFKALSAAPPNAQTLLFRLITGPELSCIPGLFSAWDVALARALKWPVDEMTTCFAEIVAQEMAQADWENGLVFMQRAIDHNRPESPNVVRHWRIAWHELPECPLKEVARRSIRSSLEDLGEAYVQAFDEITGKASRKPSAKASRKTSVKDEQNPSPNQDQEQEQEQEGEAPRSPMRVSGTDPSRSDALRETLARDADPEALPLQPDSPTNLLAVLRSEMERVRPELGMYSPGRWANREAAEFFAQWHPGMWSTYGALIRSRIIAFVKSERFRADGWTAKAFFDAFNALAAGPLAAREQGWQGQPKQPGVVYGRIGSYGPPKPRATLPEAEEKLGGPTRPRGGET